jgi:hypothetical protein
MRVILPTPLFAFERVTINPLGDKRYFAIDLTDVRAMADPMNVIHCWLSPQGLRGCCLNA